MVYFLYGIKHSKEGDVTRTYSMLITSSEAAKEPWGAMNSRGDSDDPKLQNTNVDGTNVENDKTDNQSNPIFENDDK